MKTSHKLILVIFLTLYAIRATSAVFVLTPSDSSQIHEDFAILPQLRGNNSFMVNDIPVQAFQDSLSNKNTTTSSLNPIPLNSFFPLMSKIQSENVQVGFRTFHGSFHFDSGTESYQSIGETIDPNHAFLILYSAGTGDVKDSSRHQVTGYISSPTQIRFERAEAKTGLYVSWWVVESPEITVQRGLLNLPKDISSNTQSITSINFTHSIVISNSRVADAGAGDADVHNGYITVELQDSTHILAKRATSADSKPATVRFEVITWPIEYSIFTGETTLSNTVTTTDLISGSGMSSNPVINLSNSWLYFTYDATDVGIQQTSIYGQITNTNEVTFGRYSSTSYTNRIRWHIIEHPPKKTLLVQRGEYNWNPPLAGTNVKTNTIPIAVEQNRTFILRSSSTLLTNRDFPEDKNLPRLISSTEWTSTQYRGETNSDDQHEERWQIITLPPQNYIPEVTYLTFSPEPTHSNETLTISYNFYDNDNDSEQNTKVRWYKNSVLQSAYNDSLQIPATSLNKNDVWQVSILPDDGTDFGKLVWSIPITIQNTAPMISTAFITPTSPTTTSTININYTYSDYDTDSENTSHREVLWYKNEELMSSLNNLPSVTSSNTAKGESWYFKLRVYDGTNYSSWLTSLTVTIMNSIPEVGDLSITPDFPKTTHNLTASYSFYDADNDLDNSLIRWYRWGGTEWVLQPLLNDSIIVSSDFTSKDEAWKFSIRPSDGTSFGSQQDSSATLIYNTAPTVSNLHITPSFLLTSIDLIANYTFFDSDNDNEVGTQIMWYKNGALQPDLNDSSIIDSMYTEKGDEWYFKVHPHDGENYGNWVSSPNVTIVNTSPTVSNVQIIPVDAKTDDDLILSYIFEDEDGDMENNSRIRWYQDGTLQLGLNDSIFINSGNTSKGEEWLISISPSDGEDEGIWINVSIVISNTPPIVTDIRINNFNGPTELNSDEDLEISLIYSDIDGDLQDNVSREILWYKKNQTHPTYSLQGHLNNILIVSFGNTSVNETWYCKVRVFDGTNFSVFESSPTVSIGIPPNTPPVATNLQINPSLPTTTDNLFINWTYSDVNNDSESNSMYYWYCNGEIIPTYNGLQTLPSFATSKGEVWYASVRPRDGEDFGDLVSSPNITISNSAPSVSNLEISPNNPKTGDLFFIDYTFLDVDSDLENGTRFIWYKDGILQHTLNNSRSVEANFTLKGQEWWCKVQPSDGLDLGNWISLSVNITIENTAPRVISAELLPVGSVYTSDNLTADFERTDDDNDPLAYRIIWFNDTLEVPALENSLIVSSDYTRKGNYWTYNVWVFDGSNWSNSFSPSTGIMILNSRPFVENVTLIGGLNTRSNVTLLYDFVDIDGDLESNQTAISWIITRSGNVIQEAPATQILPHTWIQAGDIIFCGVQPSDGEAFGITVMSFTFENGTIVVGNSLPEIIGTPIILAGERPNGTSAYYVISSLYVNYSVYDPDEGEGDMIYWLEEDGGIIVGSNYLWYRNGVLISELQDSPSVDKIYLKKGDIWISSVHPRDRYNDYGQWKNSTPIMIYNSIVEIKNVWFENADTSEIISNQSYADIDLKASWIIEDADNDDLEDFQAFWYWSEDNSTFYLKDEYGTNITQIPSSDLIKGQFWLVIIHVFDGEDWSNNRTSDIIKIVNKPPTVNNFEYIFDGIQQIKYNGPNDKDRVDEFFVDTENITISYIFSDIDNDQDLSQIQWFKLTNDTWEELIESNNSLTIPYYQTTPGESWYCIVTPYDGENQGTHYYSNPITIVSHPLIRNCSISPDFSSEGNFYINASLVNSGDNNKPKLEVEIIFFDNASDIINGTSEDGENWKLHFDLMKYKNVSYLDSTIIVILTAYILVDDFRIYTTHSFNFTLKDEAPPRILETFFNIKETDPFNITFYARIEEFGLGISQVLLYYEVDTKNTIIRGEGSELKNENKTIVPMIFVNATNTTSLYSISIDLSSEKNNEVIFWIQAIDQQGNSKEPIRIADYFPTRPLSPIEILPLLILSGIIPLLIFTSVFMTYRRHQRRIRLKAKSQIEIVEQFSDLFSLKAIICRNMHGLAFYVGSFTGANQDGDLLAGLSSAMSDFVSQVAQRSVGTGMFDVFEREGFTVLSYYGHYSIISLISEEKLSQDMKLRMQKIVNEIEMQIPREDIDTGFVYQMEQKIEAILYKNIPLELLKPLIIDYSHLNELKSSFNKNERKMLKLLSEIPSFSNTKQIFYASTFISYITSHRIQLFKAFAFLKHCYELGLIQNSIDENTNNAVTQLSNESN
ncbi:MAG: hypothetical protein ACXAC6_02920 [Candidatus Hodarchaeales archaeon]